jgi:hypothetical protein
MKNRPKGIVIIAIIMFLAAVIALIVGISIIIPGTPLDVLWTLKNSFPSGFRSTFIGMLFGIFLLILGLLALFIVWNLVKGRKWAWWITVIILSVQAIGSAARLALGEGVSEGLSDILIALIFIYFIYYLTRPGVKAYFEKYIQ